MENQINLLQYFEGKTILVTGATGFLAKVFVEKILRAQPNVKKLFLLIRKSAQKSVEQRLQEEVVDTELFRVLRERFGENFNSVISSKVIPISGDVAIENLGIVDSELRELMWREIDIIINSAATTKFYERYDVAFGINVMGTMHVQDFALKCLKLDMLLQVSTAFVHRKKEGLIAEEPLHMGVTLPGAEITFLDINVEKKIIEERLRKLQIQIATEKDIARAMKELGIERAKMHGWPNTYVFTKAMGEMVLENFKEKAKIIIFRPTIITSTFRDPFPGWIEGVRTLDALFVAYGKGQLKFFVGDPESILDMIPGDMVVHCMIASIASHSNDKNGLYVYHVGSARQNPITYAETYDLVRRFLTKNPLLDSEGKPITVRKLKVLNTMPKFHNYISIHYLPFLKGLNPLMFVFAVIGNATYVAIILVNGIEWSKLRPNLPWLVDSGGCVLLDVFVLKFINMLSLNQFESTYNSANHKFNQMVRLAEVYEPYVFSQATFDDANTDNLRVKIRGSTINLDMLNFDPKSISWDEYFMNTHFLGLIKYALK